jgi:hypothetical protein
LDATLFDMSNLNCSFSKARNSLTAGDAGLSPNETCVGVKAFICSDHRKSLFCTMVWQFMQPVRILVWSQVSRIVLAMPSWPRQRQEK